MYQYDSAYATKYIERTLSSPYNIYKNQVIAEVLSRENIGQVWDLGGNVSGLMKIEGSLRLQLEKRGLTYGAVDLVPAYFDPDFARSLGQLEANLYSQVLGVVGDLRYLPLASESVESVVCADVIEHINQPELAVAEMYRILKPGGKAVLVVPSLYKLDAIKLPHVLNKRFSSHENRLTIDEWISLLNEAGFVVDDFSSRPLGIASGLLYLSWLNPDYVPSKHDAEAVEEFSLAASSFKKAKAIIGRLDGKIDELLLGNQELFLRCQDAFKRGDLAEVLRVVRDLHDLVAISSNPDLDLFVDSFDSGAVSLEGFDQLMTMIKLNSSVQNQAFWGNSALLTLTK